MADGRMRFMLATALVFIMTTLSALGALADSGVGLGLLSFQTPDGLPEEPEPPPPPFAARLAAAGSVHALVAAAPDGWVPIAPGVDYSLFEVAGPVNVHVARMDRANLDLFLETSIGSGELVSDVEKTSSQFARYEGAVNYWGETWGNTNDVLVAINGSFFDVNGYPHRGMVQSGWYAKRFDNLESGSGFVWKINRTAFIGECVTHLASKQIITYLDTLETETFQGINVERDGDDELIVYTPHYADTTGTDEDGVEIIVQIERPMLILPSPSMAVGTVLQIRENDGDSKLFFDAVVLSATGDKAESLLENLQVGDQIGLSNSITHYEDFNCATPLPSLDWTKTYASLGGSYYFLRDGVITSPGPTPLDPLTAIAFNPQYIFFVVVDGRDPGISIGMSIDQLAAFAKDVLGATFGIAQDGGGSSTMVIDGVVVNTPSDLSPADCEFAYIPIAVKGVGGSAPLLPPSEEELELPECFIHVERAVANGIMMVALQQKTLSTTFFEGAGVVTLESVSVRLGPGSNYAAFATMPAGSNGVVAEHVNGMNGVYAKDQNWWLVKFSTLTGWVPETALGAP